MNSLQICCPACKSGIEYLKSHANLSTNIRKYHCSACGSTFAIHDFKEAHSALHSSRNTSSYSNHYKNAKKVRLLLDSGNIEQVGRLFERSFKYKFALDCISRLPKSSVILEVGSSSGQFVGYLRALGYQAYGSDISTSAVCFSNKTFGDYFFLNNDSSLQDYSFDAIVLMGTIGCVDAPKIFMQSLVELGRNRSKTIIFNAPNAQFVSIPGIAWPDTLPPDLNILFGVEFWHHFFLSIEAQNSFTQETLFLANMDLFRAILSYSMKFNFFKLIIYLRILFGSLFFGKKVPHPYGILCVAKVD